jgi:radical SAM protein with 4Fe4S-binding SPASM domain
MYFRLNPECYLIAGKKCGAIYDLIEAKIYKLNLKETNLLKYCERNKPVKGNEGILCDFKQLRLGNFYLNMPFIQKLRAGSPYSENEGDPPSLYRAFLEINNTCNRDCWFCGYYGIQRSSGCMGCNKWDEYGETLSQERWKSAIDELQDLDCKDIVITGGDLTLVWDRAMDILDYAKGRFKNIYVILHQQSLSLRKINFLSDKASLIIQTDDLNVVNPNDLITLLVAKPENWNVINKRKDENIQIDYIIKDKNMLPNDLPIASKKKIIPVKLHKFLDNLEYHPCLGHTLAINYNGNVTPCPMMRNHILGNIRDKEIYTIFETERDVINKFWKLNLDEIEKCTGCEFRYSCNDCRALEERLTGLLEGKMLCNYNPEEGAWI